MQPARPDQETLGGFLAARARRASDGWLALQTGAGLVIAVAAAIWQGPGWVLPCAIALSVTAFGTWGILDRELQECSPSGGGARTLRIARFLAALMGAVAALAALFATLAFGLGTWIS